MKIAILGNGQLAQMLVESVSDLSIKIDIFSLPEINKDGQSSEKEIDVWKEKLKNYDIITYEIENIAVDLLQAHAAHSRIFPSIDALKVSQDRFLEKNIFKSLDICTNNYMEVNSFDDLKKAASLLNYPFILKTRRFGYDGKGQYIVKTPKCFTKAWDELSKHSLIAESFVNFDYEISQVASRDQFGNIAFYPLVRNEHRNGILRETKVLKECSHLSEKAQKAVKLLMSHFNYVGTFAIEFFVKDDKIFANEMAPRVHNSGHWTIDGANVSQFRNHMLAISGKKVCNVTPLAEYILMINLIAEDVPYLDFPQNTFTKSYKKTVRIGRKMGHINIVDNNLENFIKSVDIIYQNIQATPCLKHGYNF